MSFNASGDTITETISVEEDAYQDHGFEESFGGADNDSILDFSRGKDAPQVEKNPNDVVESEDEPAEAAPATDEQPVTDEPATADNSDPGSEGQPEQPLIDGKFKTVDDVVQAYKHSERRSTQQAQQLRQAQAQNLQLQQELAQIRQHQAEAQGPPQYDRMTADERQTAELDAARYGFTDVQQFLSSKWMSEQALQAERNRALNHQNAHRAEQWQAAVIGLAEHAKGMDDLGDQVVESFQEYPELFEVLRQMEPTAVDRFGKHHLDLLRDRIQYRKLVDSLPARDKRMRQEGRDEAHKLRNDKRSAGSVASQTRTIPTGRPAPANAKAKAGNSMLSDLLADDRKR